MFGYNIPKLLIIEARRELKKNIDSNHPAVRKLKKLADKVSSRQAKLSWVVIFFGTLLFSIKDYIHHFHIFGVSSLFFTAFSLLFTPTLSAIFIKCISLLIFYSKNGIPLKQVPTCSSSSFSSRSSYSSSISVNPASGLPMCGSVDINGNAPGHSRHY